MFDLFYDLIYNQLFYSVELEHMQFEIEGMDYYWTMASYMSCLMAFICTIAVYVACCLLVVKIIKTVGRLFSNF